MAANLADALGAVDWNANISAFLKEGAINEAIEKANMRVAVWSRQFETADKGNPALSFVREMQTAGHHAAALLALGLYKPAAAAMRTMVETALYYSYFRSHLTELATLIRDPKFYIEKSDVIEFHKRHSEDFSSLQQKLGCISRLEPWYGNISGIIHGQIPGAWVEAKALSDIKLISSTLAAAVSKFVEGEEIIYRFFLCTTGRELWHNFSTPAKKALLAGLPGDLRTALGLDIA